jgi:separase
MSSSADPWLQDIVDARASLSTVTNIQQLLHGASTEPAQSTGKENARVKKSRVLATANVGPKPKSLGRSKARTAAAEPISVQCETLQALNEQQRLVLATETVNATLKSLSQALKSQSKPKSPIKNVTAPQNSLDAPVRSSRTPSSKSQRALKPRSPNVEKHPSPLRKAVELGPNDPTRATAECARIAFAYLRTHQKEQNRGTPDFQLENGMLALIGKCIAHGLEDVALKELRILKTRLDEYIGRNLATAATKKPAPRKVDQEKEAVAGLLRFQDMRVDDPVVPVVINHQLYVLKIMVAQKKPRSVEAALEHLKLSTPYSLVNLLVSQAKNPELRNKSARQLESLAQTLFSLCPSVASADDAAATNVKLCVNADAALQSQTLALRCRLYWWQIAGHKPNVDKELWAPFSKCIAACSRRAGQDTALNYQRAKSSLKQLETAWRECMDLAEISTDEADSPSLKMTYRSLSQLAQAANLTAEAMEWTTALPLGLPDTFSPETASRTIRLAALGLSGNDGVRLLESAIRTLHGSLKGGSSTLDNLLVEVTGLRKSALKACVQEVKKGKTELSSLGNICCEAIFGCLRFLIRYLGPSPSTSSDVHTIKRYQERVILASKVAKAFVDSVIVCIKSRVQLGNLEYEKSDTVLRDCFLLITELQGTDKTDETGYEFHKELQFPLVTISNLYYNLYQHQTKSPGASRSAGLTPLRRSIEVIRGRTAVEKDHAQFSVKLDRLAELFYNSGHPKEARSAIDESIREHVEAGHLHAAAESSTTCSLLEIAYAESQSSLLVKVLKQYEHIAIKYSSSEESNTGFFDNADLLPEERGLLLEWQLAFASQTVQKSRNLEDGLVRRCRSLVTLLLNIYSPESYPIRRLRVAVAASRLIAEQPLILDEVVAKDVEACLRMPRSPLGKDTGLQKYRVNLLAMLRAAKALRSVPVNILELETSILDWQTVLDSCASTESLLNSIDDLEAWIAQVSVTTDYLEMQGIHRLLIPTLHLLSKVHELKPERNHSSIIQTQSKLALVYLRLGYSGKAGLLLAKTEPLLEQSDTRSDVIVRWYLTYAEYALEIGNTERCEEALHKVEKCAMDSAEFASMSGPTATSSSRLRLSRLLADASDVYARYHLRSGCTDEAFRYARNCVRLNQRVWMSLESRVSAVPGPTPSSTDTEMETANMSISGFSAGFTFGKPPVVSSMTHESLSGPAFWSLVPALYRSLSHLSSIFAHHGMISEAVHYAEQAKRVASAVNSPACVVECATHIADLWTRGGNVETAQSHMDEAVDYLKELKDCPGLIRHRVVAAQMWRARGEIDDEIESQDDVLGVIDRLTAPDYLSGLYKLRTGQDHLADTMAGLSLAPKPSKAARGRKAVATKAPAKTKGVQKITAIKSTPATLSTVEECAPLVGLRKYILGAKAMALLSQKQDHTAVALFEQAQQLSHHGHAVSDAITASRLLFREMAGEMASNLKFSALLESTVALPALAHSEKGLSTDGELKESAVKPRKTPAKTPKKTASRKAPVARAAIVQNFAGTLQKARDGLVQAHALTLKTSSTSTIQEFFQLLGSNTVLLSAAAHMHPKAHINALPAAFFIGMSSFFA